MEAADLRDTALLFKAWKMEMRSISEIPVRRAAGCSSSTTSGSATVGGTMAFPGYFIGNQRAQITGVLHPGVEQIVFHLFVNGIHPAGRRLHRPATGNDGIKSKWNIRLGKQSQYKVLTVRILFVDVANSDKSSAV